MRTLPLLIVLFVLSGCGAPVTPAALDHTPGAPITIDDRRVTTSDFSADYPPGWRVITSPAGAEPFVLFAAPDNCALIAVTSGGDPIPDPAGCATAAFKREERPIGAVRVVLVADEATWDTYAPLLDTVADSVQPSTPPAPAPAPPASPSPT